MTSPMSRHEGCVFLLASLVVFCFCGVESVKPSSLEGMWKHDEMLDSSHDENHIRHKRQIMIGTRWCGGGSNAENYADLGFFKREDMCCRDHDHCTRHVVSGASQYGVTNTSPYTWSDCECDDKFRHCLRDLNTKTSNAIGNIFFNFAQFSKCLKFADDGTATAVDKGNYVGKNDNLWNKFWSWMG